MNSFTIYSLKYLSKYLDKQLISLKIASPIGNIDQSDKIVAEILTMFIQLLLWICSPLKLSVEKNHKLKHLIWN